MGGGDDVDFTLPQRLRPSWNPSRPRRCSVLRFETCIPASHTKTHSNPSSVMSQTPAEVHWRTEASGRHPAGSSLSPWSHPPLGPPDGDAQTCSPTDSVPVHEGGRSAPPGFPWRHCVSLTFLPGAEARQHRSSLHSVMFKQLLPAVLPSFTTRAPALHFLT